MRLVACRATTLYQTSLVRLPSTPESCKEEAATQSLSAEVPSPIGAKVNMHQLNGDAFARGTHLVVASVSISSDHSKSKQQGMTLFHDLDSFRENHTADMVDPEETLENSVTVSENSGMPAVGFSIEGSCMCLAPLAESSASPCDSSSIQVNKV